MHRAPGFRSLLRSAGAHRTQPDANRRIVKRLRDAAVPVVFLDRRPEESPAQERFDLAGLDNQRAGYIATHHLLQLGARRIGFVAYRHQASTVKGRIMGYGRP